MKCLSCDTNIDPKWSFAISENICPMCGKPILEENLKNLLTALRETMTAMQEYPNQLDDWLLSNHNYIKTDSPNIGEYMPKEMLKDLKKLDDDQDFQKRKDGQKFTVKVQTETGEEDVQAETLQSESKTNDFFKRAEVIKKNSTGSGTPQSPAEKTQYLKKVAAQIKKAGTGMNMGADMSEESIDPEEVAELESMLSGGEIASSMSYPNDDDDIPPAVLAMAAKGKGSSSNASDLLKLQQMQDRIRNSKDNFENGTNRGNGGFSRS